MVACLLSFNFMVLPSSSETNLLAPSLPLLPLSQTPFFTSTLYCFKISKGKKNSQLKVLAYGRRHFPYLATIVHNSF